MVRIRKQPCRVLVWRARSHLNIMIGQWELARRISIFITRGVKLDGVQRTQTADLQMYEVNIREIKIHVYPERQTWICTTWPKFSPYFPFTVYCFYSKISSFMPALSIRIALDCFYLLIFYSEKFSTDVCRLPYAVNVNLNLSIVVKCSNRFPIPKLDF